MELTELTSFAAAYVLQR